MIRISNLDVSQPVDLVTPIENLGGETTLYITMLKRFEGMSLTNCLKMITDAMNKQDWDAMKQGAHQLKGASGYIGGSRVHYICYHIQKAHHDNNIDLMIGYYPLLVEHCIELKRFVRRYLEEQREVSGKSGSPSSFPHPNLEFHFCRGRASGALR